MEQLLLLYGLGMIRSRTRLFGTYCVWCTHEVLVDMRNAFSSSLRKEVRGLNVTQECGVRLMCVR